MKDILVYISDQHSWNMGFGSDEVLRTPNLHRLAQEGTVMENCYTAYPMCVPARMSMMSGQLAGNCGVMNNFTALDSNRATFAHCLNSIGYNTVLCGRMHFVGGDQRHGFSKRIAGEMTPIFQNRPLSAFKEERGVHLNTPTGGPSSLSIIGGGDSPTLAYDRYVIEKAKDYLAYNHDEPMLMVVGTYAPHHPYVAPVDLYEYYYDKVTIPEETFSYPEHPAISGKVLFDPDPDVVRAVRASYYGMVEFEDQKIGETYDAFQQYLSRTGHEGVFVYVSDHGDHAGYRGLYGKGTFYDAAVHVPMVFAGEGIAKGKKVSGAVSLMDLGPTLCEIAGAPAMPCADGVSLNNLLSSSEDNTERMVISEVGGDFDSNGCFYYGQMVKKCRYKYIHYDGYDDDDALYDTISDPLESANVIAQHQELVKEMQYELLRCCRSIDDLKKMARQNSTNLMITSRCNLDSEERWHCPACARNYPAHMVSSKKFKK